MHFQIEVGDKEKHEIQFHYNQIMGILKIKVDGKVIRRDLRFLSFTVLKVYSFTVGEKEKLFVKIEKERRLFLSFLFPQRYRVIVDGKLFAEFNGF
jgi:hypothetical protein